MEKIDISVVIPAYNEERRIGPTLEKVYGYFISESPDFEIIVVDDGSRDKTSEITETFSKKYQEIKVFTHKENRGKGAAVKTGILNSKGRLVLFSDSDLSTPIEELQKLKKAIDVEGYNIAIGSRTIKGSRIVVKQPLYRRLLGKIFPCLVKLIVLKNFKDTQCGFKLFTKDAAKTLFKDLNTRGFAFDVEILYRGVKKQMEIKEIPVTWLNSDYSSVNVLKDPFLMLAALFNIKKNVDK